MILVPKNWADFQHYKDRSPPWVKLHKTLLEDRDFSRLPIASKALAPMLWLLASESKDGSFDASLDELTFRLRWTEADITAGLKPLIDKGLFIVDGEVLAECLQTAVPETETETETETGGTHTQSKKEIKLVEFSEFWNQYPKRKNKGDAEKAWMKLNPTTSLQNKIFKSLELLKSSDDWKKQGGQFIPYPASWLNAQGWEDEVSTQQSFAKIKTRQSANGTEWLHPTAGWVSESNVPMPRAA